ncbi:MAG: VanZ family protein [Flavobacteriaceae bacterium]
MLRKIAIIYSLFIIVISLIPIPRLPLPEFNLSDKLWHGLAYMIMTFLWLSVNLITSKKIEFKYIFFVISVALITEILQGVLPIGRYFEIADMVANFIGILFGYIIVVSFISKNKVT